MLLRSKTRTAGRESTLFDRTEPLDLLLSPSLLRSLGEFASRAGGCETGGPLLGTVERSWDGSAFRSLVSVLGTVPPGGSLRASPASVGMGAADDGERSAGALRWLREVTSLDLVHVGDWHLHPRGCPHPSEGDVQTAQRMLSLTPHALWIVAVCVFDEVVEWDIERCNGAAALTRARADRVEARFYQAVRGGGLVPVEPALEAASLPSLPPLPWHIADPARLSAECRLLHAAGFEVGIKPSPELDGAGLELRVKGGSGRAVLVSTAGGYPQVPPVIRDEHGHPVKSRHPWVPTRYLVDVVSEVTSGDRWALGQDRGHRRP